LVFDSIAIQLRGSGFAKEQIDLIIKALQEESGKTDFKFNFANVDLSTDEGILNFDKNFGVILKELDSGITEVYDSMLYRDNKLNKWVGGVVTKTSEEAKVNLKLATDAATGFINGLTGQLKSGTISAEQFAQGFGRIGSAIASMPKPEQLLLLKAIIKTLPEDIQKGVNGLTNFNDQLFIIRAQAVGLTMDLTKVVAAMNMLDKKPTGPNAGGRIRRAEEVVESFKKELAVLEKAFGLKTPTSGSGTKDFQSLDDDKNGKKLTDQEKYLKVLQKEIDALKEKRDAQKDANEEVQRQIDLQMKLQDLSNQAVEAKISGNYIQAAMFEQQSQNVQMEFNKETELRKKDAEIATLEARYKAIKDGAKLTTAEIAKIPKTPKKVVKKANGGLIKGPGTGRSDSIRATLGYAGGGSIRVSNGEFVVKASSVKDYGLNAMNAVNNGTADISTNSGGTVYNINMPITSNAASPEGVANEVMRRLKVELNKNNKSNRVNI
jgi:hypothetical protein